MSIKKNGFTLIELLIGFTILAILAVTMAGIFNAAGITNKARDAQRKKDLGRIKVAFEEYFNDKGYYPRADLVAKFMDANNCGKSIADFPQLKPWPCDPNGQPYITFAEDGNRFRVVVNLENKKDKDIPKGWYLRVDDFNLFGKTINDINYGVSSTNIMWYDEGAKDYNECVVSECFSNSGAGCGDVTDIGCNGAGCYYRSKDDDNCTSKCKVDYCAGKSL